MANIYLNGSQADGIFALIRFGTPALQEADRFTLSGPSLRLNAAGSALTYSNGRLSGGLITEFRLFDQNGVELLSFTGLSLSASEVQALADLGDYPAFYSLLFAGDDIVRAGPDQTTLLGGPGADTFLGNGRSNFFHLEDPGDRIVEPANGGERDHALIYFGERGQSLTFRLGAGLLAGIERLDYYGGADIRVIGNGQANLITAEGGTGTVSGGGGADSLYGNFGDDSLSGGAGDDSLSGGVGRDTLLGGAGHDTIVAIGGANRIDGGSGDDFVEVSGPGADTILGGAGNDTIEGSAAGGNLILGGGGHDSISAYGTGNLVDGGAGNDTLDAAGTVLGGAGNDLIYGSGLLDGGAGNDSITGSSGSRLLGGAGDDVIGMFFGANTVQGGTGRDLFQFAVNLGLGNEIVDFRRGEDRIDLSGLVSRNYTAATFDFADGLGQLQRDGYLTIGPAEGGGLLLEIAEGDSRSSVILRGVTELGPQDVLLSGTRNATNPAIIEQFGTGGADVIVDAAFTRRINGLGGNDRIIVTRDQVNAYGDAGNDTIEAFQYGLLDGGAGNDLLIVVAGDAFGEAGNDTLIARGPSVQLIGGAGNDLYLVSDSGASVFEEADAGIDTVGVGFDYRLGDNVEHLFQTDPHATGWRGTGNALANRITGGRAGSSDLFGGGGNDTLTGGNGDDTLDGGAGADRMVGGGGDDSYFVDHAGDRIVERANEGYDTVSVTLNAYTLGANLEDLRFAGQGDFRGTGNGVHNRIFGGGGADTLSGGGGDDTLVGAGGADRLTGGTGADTFVIAGDAMDRVTDFSRAQGDRLDLRALVTGVLGSPMTFEQLTGSGVLHWEAQGRDLVLYLGAGTASPITLLQGQAALELQASDFVL